MYRLRPLLLFFFLILSTAVSAWDDDDEDYWDDDEEEFLVVSRTYYAAKELILEVDHFVQGPLDSPISYNGLSFDCEYGCGDPDFDPNMGKINHICSAWVPLPCLSTPKRISFAEDLANYLTLDLSIGGKAASPLQRLGNYFSLSPWEREALMSGIEEDYEWEEQLSHEEFIEFSNEFLEQIENQKTGYYEAIEKLTQDCDQVLLLQQKGYDQIIVDHGPLRGCFKCPPDAIRAQDLLEQLKKDQQREEREVQAHEQYRTYVEEAFAQVDALYKKIFEECLTNHQGEGVAFREALEYFTAGEYHQAIEKIDFLISLAIENSLEDTLLCKLYALKGKIQTEGCQYSDAIITLTEAVAKDPSQKQLLFDRAVAYFELGEFTKSLKDYLSARPKLSSKPTPLEMLPFALGLSEGVLTGGVEARLEFIPSILASFQGIGHGLWAFAQDPITISANLTQAAYDCVEFIIEHTPTETISRLIPEFGELIEKWETMNDQQRGVKTGFLIGKYGVDIFAGTSLVKGMKAYHQLKKANNLLTFEAMAVSQRNQQLILTEAVRKGQARQAALKANFTIKPDAQGKHIVGHRNYQPLRNRSITEHPDLQGLVNKFAGTGIKEGPCLPGTPGYREIVDFKEFIGYHVERETGKKTATTWGKIHYAKDGVHVVPFEWKSAK